MARVENDTSDSEDSDGKLAVEDDTVDSSKDTDKNDCDDESITSTEDEDDVLEGKVSELELKLSQNPYNYQDHLDVITILQQLEDPFRLMSAYERLSTLFPLAPRQWLSWLQLKAEGATSEEDRLQRNAMFERAFVDCYSSSIYLEWCASSMGATGGSSEARKAMSAALEAAGADPVDGGMLWDTAKEYELALLSLLSSSSEEYPGQVMRVFEVFSRQLSHPLLQSDKAMEEFRIFTDTMQAHIPNLPEEITKVEESYSVSEEILKQILDFEHDLEVAEDNKTEELNLKCSTYRAYISHVRAMSADRTFDGYDTRPLLRVLYDRATTECCAEACRLQKPASSEAEALCLEWTEYTREKGTAQEALAVIEKVIRRCPRKSSLWVAKLQQIERMERDFNEIKVEFEKSLFTGFDDATDYVALWQCYLETLRRHTDFSSSENVDRLRKTFRLAWDSLGQMWGDTADTEFSILQFWARIEYQHMKDYEYGKELFEEIFEYGDNRLHGGLWLEYFHMERLCGGAGRARAVLKRAVRASNDPRLRRSWRALERDHGTLEQLVECNKICDEKDREWEKIRTQNNANPNFKNRNQNKKFQNDAAHNKQKKKGKGKFDTEAPSNSKTNNNKSSNNKSNNNSNRQTDTFSQPISNSKKRKLEETNGNSKKFKNTTSEKSPNTKQNDAKRKHEPDDSGIPNKRPKETDIFKKPAVKPPPGYEAFKAEESRNDVESPKSEEDDEKNSRTAFVSNLDFKVDEEALRSKLSEFGEIEEMRLVQGVKSFGSICYCVYINSASVEVALSHDRTPLDKRPMFISRYSSSKDARQKHFVYPTGVERNKLFVRNIAFDHCTEDRLRDVFAKYGQLKDIRIVMYKNGNPKGLAYVEYCEESGASAALREVDGLDVGGRPLSVAFSAPPARKKEFTANEAPSNPNTSLRGHSRTQLFMPSVLQRSTLASTSKEAPTQTPASTSKLTNSDFRSMLLSKK